jgi:hypothetical protein
VPRTVLLVSQSELHVPIALLGLEFDCLSTLQLLMCLVTSPSAALLTHPRFVTDSSSTALRFRLFRRSLSQGQVCNLHYPFPLVKSVSRRLLLSSATPPVYLTQLRSRLPTTSTLSLLSTAYYLLPAYYLLLRTSPAAQSPARRVARHFASANPLVRHKRKCYTTSLSQSNPTPSK